MVTVKPLAARLGFGLLVASILVYVLFPFVWAVGSSFKPAIELYEPTLVPNEPTGANYVAIFLEQPFGRNILNSAIVAVATVLVSTLLAVPASFALGRVRFRGRLMLLGAVLGVTMFPQVAILSGMFELLRTFGLYNTLPGLVLAYLTFALPFTVWVLTTFVRELPREIEEAAVIDGAGPWIVLTRVLLPLVAPALVTTTLLTFIAAWNEFLFALTFTLSSTRRTVPVAIALMSGVSEQELPWGRIMAASVVVTVPLIALVLVFQRRIVQGLTAGAVKG